MGEAWRVVVVLGALAISGCQDPATRPVDAGRPPKMDACSGLQCRQVDCALEGKAPTTLTGTVYAPNETLALFGVDVYVPNLDPGPFQAGVSCERCNPTLPGEPITNTRSAEDGTFTLTNPPVGTDIPLIVTTGKWRRIVTIPEVLPCVENELPKALTRLPRNKQEGDLPQIAIVTGLCDALECLVRNLGVAESEFTNDTGDGRVHLFTEGGSATTMSGQTLNRASTSLWKDLDKMKQYDLQLNSCECGRNGENKPQEAMDIMKAYADGGGRVFLSHYHHVWLEGIEGGQAPAVWPEIATCQADNVAGTVDIIDQNENPRGTSFAKWMLAVGGSTTLGEIMITEGKETCSAIDADKAERWVYTKIGRRPQNFQFTTPQEAELADRCGKVVFSDMHVASGSLSMGAFPAGCKAATDPLTPQEKALAFMFFDIATCIDDISKPSR